LVFPIFKLTDVHYKWGSWNPSTRVMTFSLSLLRNYEWGAVEHVLRHELAHQIVSEIFGMDCYGVSHGELWGEACKIVDIAPVRCDSDLFLSSFKSPDGPDDSSMVDKVRKLLIHANDSGATEAEAESFMVKAKELMLRHDIKMQDISGNERLWVVRPIGPLFKRWPVYMWKLGKLLSRHYNVNCIQTYGPDGTHRLELFGEPSNLDIAEYVGHALLNQADYLYEKQKVVHKMARDEMNATRSISSTPIYMRRLSKRAFIEGLLDGYSNKLTMSTKSAISRVGVECAKERAVLGGSKYVEGDMAIVPVYNRKLLDEMYGNHYQRICHSQYSGSRGEGRSAGREAGLKLTLSKGVSCSGNGGRLLV
jgi:hypothetical protein